MNRYLSDRNWISAAAAFAAIFVNCFSNMTKDYKLHETYRKQMHKLHILTLYDADRTIIIIFEL